MLDPLFVFHTDQVARINLIKNCDCYVRINHNGNISFQVKYKHNTSTLHVRTEWELEQAKSIWLNISPNSINWDVYNEIRAMYYERFKIYSPYLGR